MNIGFYNPFLDSLSGGERYFLSLVSHWSQKHAVTVFWDDPSILKDAEVRLHIPLTNLEIKPNFFKHRNLSKFIESTKYDVMFIVSDGSIPFLLAKHNLLHFQVPFQNISFPAWKIKRYDAVVFNSRFTQDHLPVFPIRKEVIYPPVQLIHSNTVKQKIILTVGRFTSYHTSKKQDILLNVFRSGYEKGLLKDYTFILAGGLLDSDRSFFQNLQKTATGLPVKFKENCSYSELSDLYKKSQIYWHAAGYDEINPEFMEHFGISTVEAMSAGCIPIVYNAGGQTEIITDGEDGYLWNTPEELLKKTKTAINTKNEKFINNIRQSSMFYDEKHFCQKYDDLLTTIIQV